MSLQSFAEWLDATPVSLALKNSALVIPLVQSVHILAVAFVFSGAVLTVLRADRDGALAGWTFALISRQWVSFVLLLVSGGLLAIAEPTRELVNGTFQLKLLLVAIAVPLAVRLAAWQRTSPDDLRTRRLGWALLALWIVIIIAGRWIAYS